MVGADIRVALRALRVNRMRSALTMLGIVIGVAAVVAMVAVGVGAQTRIAEQIRSLGSNLIIVLPGTITQSGVRLGAGSQTRLSQDDAEAIQDDVEGVIAAAPMVRGGGQAVYGNMNWSTAIQGVTPEFFVAREWDVAEGRQIAPEDVDSAARVVVLGRTVVANLFIDESPIGRSVRIRNVPFTVIGELDPKGQSTMGQDQDDVVLIPISTAAQKVLGASQVQPRAAQTILVKVQDGADAAAAQQQIQDVLRQRHRIQPQQEDDFSLRNLSDVLSTQEESSRVLTILLAAIASVSLAVGGIGIMNIMLVSVTERTREIGLRMAVGAKNRDILVQFLVEALTLSLIGGVLGVLAGVGTTYAIAWFAGWQTVVQPLAVALAVGFSAAVGVFFGFYPAHKASHLDPIEALRYE